VFNKKPAVTCGWFCIKQDEASIAKGDVGGHDVYRIKKRLELSRQAVIRIHDFGQRIVAALHLRACSHGVSHLLDFSRDVHHVLCVFLVPVVSGKKIYSCSC
jgi:hypothetical protein